MAGGSAETRIAALRDRLPSVRSGADLALAVRPAEGVVAGLPGAVTDLTVSQDGRSSLPRTTATTRCPSSMSRL